MFVAVCNFDKVGTGIAVGQVKTVDTSGKTFVGMTYSSSKQVYEAECVAGAWNRPTSLKKKKQAEDDFDAWAVVTYFDQLTKPNKLPSHVQRIVRSRNIPWGQTS